VRDFLHGLDRRLLRLYPSDIRLRHEFNLWAENGLGKNMELDHTWFTERALSKMSLSPADCILDLGCGEGWSCRLMAARSLCRVVGLDVSDEMVRRAQTESRRFGGVAFLCGSAEHIPCRDSVFTKVLSVSAFYYFERQENVLKELFRAVAPGGQLFILLGLYQGLPDWRDSARKLRVPTHLCSADEYKSMLRVTGWIDVEAEEFVQECQPGLKSGGHERALFISAHRPALERAMVHSSQDRTAE